MIGLRAEGSGRHASPRRRLALAVAANVFVATCIALQVSAMRAGPPPSPALLKRLAELPRGLQAGDPAPDLALASLSGGPEVALHDLHREKPLVLVFGSLTCPAFRDQAANLQRLHREFADDAAFCLVYIREAHPADEGSLPENERARISLAQPRTLDERAAAARACQARLGMDVPVLLDGLDNRAADAFGAWPRHLCVVGVDGRVVHRGRGGGDFSVPETAEQLRQLLRSPG